MIRVTRAEYFAAMAQGRYTKRGRHGYYCSKATSERKTEDEKWKERETATRRVSSVN